jgi:hypothetical protein
MTPSFSRWKTMKQNFPLAKVGDPCNLRALFPKANDG